MGKIISLVAPKGGAGKSTLILCLAHARAFRRLNCCIIDTDEQGSLWHWWRERLDSGLETGKKKNIGVEVVQVLDGEELKSELERRFDEYDVVFLDCPGESAPGVKTRTAMSYSDLVIIPAKTGEFDLSSTVNKMLPVLEEAGGGSESQFVLLPSMIHAAANKEKIVDLFSGTSAECMQSVFTARKVFSEFQAGGLTLNEYHKQATRKDVKSQAAKAVSEVDALADEIFKYLNI